MLATKSAELKGTEKFDEAFALIPEQSENVNYCYLYTKDGVQTNVAQITTDGGSSWSTKICKYDKDKQIIPINLNSKEKLKNTQIIYDIFTKPQYAGGEATQSWLTGQIDQCKILGDDYSVSGLIISTIFDPQPKFYISFERLVCENQFSTLGKNNASMYIDMNKFLKVEAYTDENRRKLAEMIQFESEKRIADADRIYNRLATTHLTNDQVYNMFQMLTVNKVAKANEDKYHQAELEYENYKHVYNLEDNQNFKGSLFGFVNACTNIQTRKKTNPLDVIKPVLPADVVNSPCNFEYLCRAAMLQNV